MFRAYRDASQELEFDTVVVVSTMNVVRIFNWSPGVTECRTVYHSVSAVSARLREISAGSMNLEDERLTLDHEETPISLFNCISCFARYPSVEIFICPMAVR